MSSKGVSKTLWILVTAVIVLVVALMLLVILNTGITPVVSLADARNNCLLQCRTICVSEDSLMMPPTWNTPTMLINNERKSCYDALSGVEDCSDCWGYG